MSPHAYTENQLVEQPAIGLFAALGWQTASAIDETFGPGGTLGRETRGVAMSKEAANREVCRLLSAPVDVAGEPGPCSSGLTA